MKTQWHIAHDSLNCPLIVSGDKKLVAALGQLTNFRGVVNIAARGYITAKVSTKVCQLLADKLAQGKPVIFQYMGEAHEIETAGDVVQLFQAVNTERLYVDGEVIKTSATAYNTVFRKSE